MKETKIYLKETGSYGDVTYYDAAKLNWTGKWKYEVITKPDGQRRTITTRRLYLQRRWMFLWVIPMPICVWENESDFEEREEEVFTNQCRVLS